MASNGLIQMAKAGRCRICQRVRTTLTKVKAVGEVRKGFATGYVWECIDQDDCDKVALQKLKSGSITGILEAKIERAIEIGRYTDYPIFTQ